MVAGKQQNGMVYPVPEPPDFGVGHALRADIDWIRLPLPFALDHVNCWYLHGDGESLLIDSGLKTNVITEHWNAFFSKREWPQSLLVTHFHPDHSGMAGWFADAGSRIITNKTEWQVVERLHAVSNADYGEYYTDWYRQHGVPDDYVEAVGRRGNGYAIGVCKPPVPEQYLQDGQELQIAGRKFSVLTGKGHAPEMLMLYCENDRLLIAADQVLPGISPNVSLMPGSEDDNPLSSFLESLAKLTSLPSDTLVLPSHGLPFTGLHQRLDQLQRHHEERLELIHQALANEQHAAGLFELLFKRKLDDQQMSFALGETLAHIRYLEYQGRVERSVTEGVIRFRSCDL